MARSKDYISLINSQRWKSLRRYHLSGHQWCERCLRNGRHTPASEVHHVIPVESVFGLEAMKRLMFDPLNLMSVCRQCHCNIHTELGSRSTMLRRSKFSIASALNLPSISSSSSMNPSSGRGAGGQSPKMSIPTVSRVRSAVLRELQRYYGRWHREGFAAVYGEITERDFLKGRTVSVLQTDDDASPVSGTCGGIAEDGTLAVGGVKIYAGEAHVEKID